MLTVTRGTAIMRLNLYLDVLIYLYTHICMYSTGMRCGMEQVPTVIEHGQQIADRHVVVRLFFRWTTWEGLHPDIADYIKGAKLDRPNKKIP